MHQLLIWQHNKNQACVLEHQSQTEMWRLAATWCLKDAQLNWLPTRTETLQKMQHLHQQAKWKELVDLHLETDSDELQCMGWGENLLLIVRDEQDLPKHSPV